MDSSELTRLVIYSTTAIVCTVTGVVGIVGAIAFYRTRRDSAKSFGLLFQRGNLLRIAAVLMIIIAVIYLSLLGKLTDGAVAILSGTAGYVLGGLERGKDTQEPSDLDT